MASVPIVQTEQGESGLDEALKRVSDTIGNRKTIEAIAASLDPTATLTTRKVLPFSDPKIIDKILPQSLTDVWKMSQDMQLAFEVGGVVKAKTEDDSDGFDIHVISYSKASMLEEIAHLRTHALDPQLMIPPIYVLKHALSTIIKPQEGVWGILDIGAKTSSLCLCQDDKVILTRAFKLGSSDIDESITQSFDMSLLEAQDMKERCGFVALPKSEAQVYDDLTQEGTTELWDVDPALLASACAQGLSYLLSALRQTLASARATHQANADILYLTGRGSKLANLAPWLSEQLGIKVSPNLPLLDPVLANSPDFSLNALALAVAASDNIDEKILLNLRRGSLAHKGSLEFLKDNKWLVASLIVLLIAAQVFMLVTRLDGIKAENIKLKAVLEETSNNVFGKPLMSVAQIQTELEDTQGYSFIPERTAFTHFEWLSNQVHENMAEVEMDLSALDIDTQRKIVVIRGEVSGEDGLPRFMQLLEQYECFPREIQEPKTSKIRDRTGFTLRVDLNRCSTGGGSND